ncbi:MAG TPA: glycine zipper family protein [Thermodesulfobacteriota bacterium]
MRDTITGMALGAVVALAAGLASAQSQPSGGQIVYPAKGQSDEQQSRDRYECQEFAVKESGFDPTARAAASPAPAAPPAQSGAAGGAARGAARGAAAGAVGGAIAGDAGEGAAVGAGVGAATGAVRKRQQAKEQQAAAAQAQASQQAARAQAQGLYDRATRACLEGRGYTVR